MASKYTTLYREAISQQYALERIGKSLPKSQKQKGTPYYKARHQLRELLHEIDDVLRSLAS